MNDIINIKGIEGYEKDGTVYLKLETVARGLGFTQTAASGNEVVRWERVRKYLADFGVPTSGDGHLMEYIPENVFYRLAMKAKSETAERFQAFVADEVLPSIRKHGAYMTPDKLKEVLLNPDTIIQLAQTLKEEQETRRALEHKLDAQQPKVIFADAVTASEQCILIGQLAKLLRQNGIPMGERRLFQWMRENGYLGKNGNRYNIPTQRAMELGLFEIKETAVTHADGHVTVSTTPKVTGKGQVYFVNRLLTERKR